MATTVSQGNIQVYLLAAPDEQSVCEELIKHLKPIVRNSPVPISIGSDFNIPSGADVDEYKQRLFDADIVLALISADFLASDEIDSRNQKVIKRYNSKQTVMIPILVRNCMWKATPFSKLPMVPKNLQPLNNKEAWPSPDEAVTNVVNDIYDLINKLSQQQIEEAQAQVNIVQTAPSAQEAPVKPAQSKAEPLAPAKEPVQAQTDTVKPAPPSQKEPAKPAQSKAEPLAPAKEPAQAQVKAVPQAPAIQAEKVSSAPIYRAPSSPPIRQATNSIQFETDWRQKYYRTVLMKRAGAYLLDWVFSYIVSFVISMILLIAIADDDIYFVLSTFLTVAVYYVIMPLMESSKWQGTIGKRILKLQITNKDGERVTFIRALWRNIMRSLVFYSYFLIVPLIIQINRFNKIKKLFHDELSGTVIGESLLVPVKAAKSGLIR